LITKLVGPVPKALMVGTWKFQQGEHCHEMYTMDTVDFELKWEASKWKVL
jgi:hypothetical protein